MKHARDSLRNLIVVGDRVLIEPDDDSRTHSGLFLPQGVHETDGVRQGRVVAMGPGVPLPAPHEPDDDEPWKKRQRQDRYLPMQVKLGDYALFFKKAAVEVRYEGDTFLVVPQSAILILIRDGGEGEADLGLPPPPPPL